MAHAFQQEELGDPSGQSSSEYWDEWFQKVSPDEGFEWYCDASEIARILLRSECSSKTKEEFVIFHPGSGNSAVPFRLCEDYGFSTNRICSKQCIMDCSAIAVQQMMMMKGGPLSCCTGIIEYHVGDVLHPPLPYLDQTFDAWIDKGLVDALFCGDNTIQESEQCATLFQEARRVLKHNGICIIVSLAQDHTIDLILHASGWINHDEGNNSVTNQNNSRWLAPIEIHEVKPLSDASSLRPFVFVLRIGPSDEPDETNCSSPSHSDSSTIPGDQRPILVFFDQNGTVRSSISKHNFCLEAIRNMVQTSQREYLDKWNANKSKKCDNSIYYVTEEDEDMFYVLAKIHIKPWDVDTNLQELKERIKSNTEYTTLFKGLSWKSDEIKGIGFGINSLLMSLVIPQASLEELCECIATEEEEYVQSVDIDWESTCRILTNSTAMPISTKC